MTDEVLTKQKKAKEIRDRIEKLKHSSDDHAVETLPPSHHQDGSRGLLQHHS